MKVLPAKKIAVIKALARGLTRDEAARSAGVSPRSVYRWLAEDPVFVRELERAQSDYMRAVNSGLCSAGSNAIQYLNAVVRGDATGDNYRIRAATALLGAAATSLKLNFAYADIVTKEQLAVFVNSFLRVLQRRIADPELLREISHELEQLWRCP